MYYTRVSLLWHLIGGFDLAAEWVGFENLFHCEWNPFCRQVLKHHFPNSESYEDITKTDFTKWRGKIDVLTGGFPCQPFSVAGSRKGAEDDRYLWPQMLRAIEEIRPSWVIGENVAGILSMVLPGEEIEVGGYTDVTGESFKGTEERQLYVVERICQDFDCIGYSVQPIIIPACAVGAPHRRDRIWFVAENTVSIRCDREIREKESCIRRFGDPYTRDYERIHSKENVTSNRSDARIETQRSGKDEVSAIGFTSHTECFGRGKIHEDFQSEQSERKRIDCNGNEQYASHPDKLNDKLSGLCAGEISKQQEAEIFGNIPDWHDFPTQSPVCDRNDGLSDRLVGITFPQWRMKAIEAMGNAIVPQVAFEIFNAIKNTYHEETTNHPNQRD